MACPTLRYPCPDCAAIERERVRRANAAFYGLVGLGLVVTLGAACTALLTFRI